MCGPGVDVETESPSGSTGSKVDDTLPMDGGEPIPTSSISASPSIASTSSFESDSSDDTVAASSDIPSMEFEDLCRAVRGNDPSVTSVSVPDEALCHATHATTLCHSLRHTSHVHTLHFDFSVDAWHAHHHRASSVAVSTWTDFLCTAPMTLRAIELHHATPLLSVQRRRLDGAAACTTLLVLLQALASNANVTELTLDNRSKTHSSTTAKTAKTRRPLTSASFALPTTLQTATIASLSQCRSLDTVWLDHVDDAVVSALLVPLATLPALASLVLVPLHRTLSSTTADALSHLLQTAPSLTHLEFHGVRWTLKLLHSVFFPTHGPSIETKTEMTVESIKSDETVESIEPTVTRRPPRLELSWHDCTLDWGATHCFRTRLLASSTVCVTTLTLGRHVRLYGGPMATPGTVAALWPCHVAALNVASCEWTTAQWTKFFVTLDTASATPVSTTAVALDTATTPVSTAAPLSRTHLEHLTVGRLISWEHVQVLREHIPRVRGLQYLSVQWDWTELVEASRDANDVTDATDATKHDEASLRHDLLTAWQANTTLATCVVNDEPYNLFYYPDAEASIYDQIMQTVLSEQETTVE